MGTTPKQLIIDKDVFHGTSTDKLCDFAKCHFLILPDVLYYECATTDKDKERLLNRFREVVLACGCICTSCKDIILWEANSLSPYGSLVDFDSIGAVRETFRTNPRPYNPKQAKRRYENELNFAKHILDVVGGFNEKLGCENPELLAEIRKLPSSKADRPARLEKWAEFIDSQDMHLVSTKRLAGYTSCPEKYCLSDEWVSWQFLRLVNIVNLEKTFLRHKGDESGQIKMEHDIQDLTYVLLLCRADGILTNDKDLVIPLAQAAFPEKDVFSSLDEVPDEYLCDWN